jgi:flavin reductase (DIM6/NTAB) family NADH-FMN oxidoreductase RutF
MKEIFVHELNLNPMTLIGGEWWLIAAGNEKDSYNAMTASWGHLGSIWERPGRGTAHMGLSTAVVYLRPQRYTKDIIDREELFTLSVFDKIHRRAFVYLGTHSGRDGDKIAKVGLTPVFVEGTTCFVEAKMVFVCRKLYHAPLMESGFVDKSLVKSNYPEKDFHEMYVGEIIRVLSNE